MKYTQKGKNILSFKSAMYGETNGIKQRNNKNYDICICKSMCHEIIQTDKV